MQRALAPFRRRRGEGEEPPYPGPYYNIEKPGGAAARNMTGETLVGVSVMRAHGPDKRADSWTNRQEDDTRYLGPNPALAVQTKNLTQLASSGAGAGTGAGARSISPVSQVSQDLGSDVSPISPSFNHAGTLPIQEPSPSPVPMPMQSRPGRGTAISIAGSEARIVRIPPRSSRLPPTASGEGTGAGAWRSGSQRMSSGSTELSPPPLAINRNRTRPPVSMRAVPTPAATLAPNSNGGYQAYHPSLGNLHQGGPSRVSYESRASLSGVSVASSDVFSPDSITWPMPPGTPTTTSSGRN